MVAALDESTRPGRAAARCCLALSIAFIVNCTQNKDGAAPPGSGQMKSADDSRRSEQASAGAGRRAGPRAPTPSPSGAYSLELIRTEERAHDKTWSYLHFRILGGSGEVLCEPTDRFAAWFPVVVAWDDQDWVWVRSGDVGTVVWARVAGGWTKYVWEADGPEVPSEDRVLWDAELGRDMPIIGKRPPTSLLDPPKGL
jgi:hypothetical protein